MTDEINSMMRDFGRMEGKIDGLAASVQRVDQRSVARDAAIEEIRDDIAALKDHAKSMVEVSNQFIKLQQAIRDGANQAKGISKGFGLGIAFAAAGTGAAVAGLGRELWKMIFG